MREKGIPPPQPCVEVRGWSYEKFQHLRGLQRNSSWSSRRNFVSWGNSVSRRMRTFRALKSTRGSGVKSLMILMEAVQWAQKPDSHGLRKSGCEEAEEWSCDGRGRS